MVFISQLWLPILVSAVLVFIASSLVHTVLPYHKSDMGQVPNEDDVLEALGPLVPLSEPLRNPFSGA